MEEIGHELELRGMKGMKSACHNRARSDSSWEHLHNTVCQALS